MSSRKTRTNLSKYLLKTLFIRHIIVGAALCRWRVHVPSWWPSCDGPLFWKSEKTRWLYYLQRFSYILSVQSSGGGSSDTSHWNECEEGWTKEMEDVSSWPWLYYGDMHSYNPLAGWMKVICHFWCWHSWHAFEM